MKKSNFKVREMQDKRFVIEEDSYKNSLFLLLKKNKKSIFVGITTLIVCLLLVSVGIVFSLFRGSNNYDITYIVGSEQIEINKDPNIDDEDIEDELLGEISRSDGVVVLVENVMTPKGEIISYYTDGSAVMVSSKGKIYRVSTNSKGEYGVAKNGKIDKTAIKVLVTSTTSTLSDGTVVTYYSDGTAKVELKNKSIFVRDSNNILVGEGNVFDNVKPSGVALTLEISRINGGVANKFSDGTVLVKRDKEVFLINKDADTTIENGIINYVSNNTYIVISEKTYSDGNTITYYSNGSATVTDSKGKIFYVKSSGDLSLKNKKLYEIIPNDKANSMGNKKTHNKVNVVYFDNGAAIVVYPNNDRKYVENSDDIVFDSDNKLNEEFEYFKLVSIMLTQDNKKAYSFENGKTQVINSDNSSYIVDTDTLELRPIVEEKPEPDEEPEVEEEEEGIAPVPEGDIYMSEAEYYYKDQSNEQGSVFKISNNYLINKKIMIVIEEVKDYDKYNTKRLNPELINFYATFGNVHIKARPLTYDYKNYENICQSCSSGSTSYIIYDGELKAKEDVVVGLALYPDYERINDNNYQNSGFIGTIKLYVYDDVL